MSDPQLPSHLLKTLAASHSPATYHKFLQDHIYPFLDSLPKKHKDSLLSILKDAELEAVDETSYLDLIDYRARKESITGQLQSLWGDVESDWKDGYEEQGEMMNSIAEEVGEWLETLWRVGVENGVEHDLVNKCLEFCKSTHTSLGNTNSRAEYGDLDISVTITDTSGKLVFKSTRDLETAILWVWRDLLLSAMVHDPSGSVLKRLLLDIEGQGIAHEMLKRLDEETVASEDPPATKKLRYDDPKRDWKKEKRRDLLMNYHWTSEMRAAVPIVKARIISRRLDEFEEEPTYEIYSSLVSTSPELQERLLTTARNYFFVEKKKLGHAFRIFEDVGSDVDLLKLLEIADDADYSDSRLKALTFLGTRGTDIRSQARPHLEKSLINAQHPILHEMAYAFPTLDSAWPYLEKQMRLGKFPEVADEAPVPKRPKYEPYKTIHNGVHPRDPDPKRDPILRAFCRKAGWAQEPEPESESDEDDYDDYGGYGRGYGYDSDDDEEEKSDKDLALDLISALQRWVEVLEKWSDAGERSDIRATLRAKHKGLGKLFFNVDGAADALARLCDYGSPLKPCRQKLGRAIREVYHAFAEDGAEKERIKKDLSPHMSFVVVW